MASDGSALGGLFVVNFIGLESAEEMPAFFLELFFVCAGFLSSHCGQLANPLASDSKA